MKKVLSSALVALALTTSSAMAQDFAIGVTAGTLGLGLEGTTNISEKVNVRLIAAGYKYSKDGTSGGDLSYQADAKLFNVGALVDYYPFTNFLRLSAGAIYNGTKVTAAAQPNIGSTYTINGTTYTAADVGSATGEVKYQKVMPYLGFGFGNTMANGNFTIGMDFGAMIGKPTASLTITNPTNNATLANDAAIEEAKFKDEANKYNFYPVVNMSISYRF